MKMKEKREKIYLKVRKEWKSPRSYSCTIFPYLPVKVVEAIWVYIFSP